MIISDIIIMNYCFISTIGFLKKFSFLKQIGFKIINFIISLEIENRIWGIDSIEQLLFEYVELLERFNNNKTTKISSNYKTVNTNNDDKFIYKAVTKKGQISYIACQFYDEKNEFKINIDLNISTSIALTKLTCSFTNKDGNPVTFARTSELMKCKNDIIMLIRRKIIEYVKVYLHQAMNNSEEVLTAITSKAKISRG